MTKLRIPLHEDSWSLLELVSCLVRVELYSSERTVGSRKCSKKRCKVCENVQNSVTFRSSVTSEKFKISHRLTCDDECLVYLFTCKTCSK